MRTLLGPWAWLTAPKLYHERNLPKDRPFLLVGNHTLMGVLDVPLLVLAVHDACGTFVRSLGDHLHFRVPIWRDLLMRFGTVDGTPENCRALMSAGQSILVFPGGGREVFKHKGEKYHLIWKSRMGFARLAIEYGYTIVPFAAVGAEECYEILLDGEEIRRSPIGALVERVAPRSDEIPPLVQGIGPLPRPERFYFWFGTPVETRPLRRGRDRETASRQVRDRVRRSIQAGLHFLLEERQRDPQRELGARIVAQFERLLR